MRTIRLWNRINLGAAIGLTGIAAGCAVEPTAAVEEVRSATLAGRSTDGSTFVAVVRNENSFLIYACDDERDAWFRAESFTTPMEFQDALGNTLFLALNERGDEALGQITFGEGEAIPFTLAQTEEEVLFRAEGVLSGENLLGGWIRLPDGEQRGTIRQGMTRTTSRLEGVVVSPERFARLQPAAFTPAALTRPAANRAEAFYMYGMGDSYSAGEGAPERPGMHDESGHLLEDGMEANWDTALTGDAAREARACHRSGISGIEIAAQLLRDQYAGALDVRLQSFACSGSQTEHLMTCSYRGAIGDHFNSAANFVAPQIERVENASRTTGVDAIVMGIGGNDMRFGPLISQCLAEAVLGGDSCGPGSEIEGIFEDSVEGVEAKYAAIASRLSPLLPSANVFLTQPPNPIVDQNGVTCPELDLGLSGGVVSSAIIRGEDMTWLGRTIVPQLLRAVRDGAEANDWTLVSAHVEDFADHSYCSSQPWFVRNPQSLREVGRQMTDSLNDHTFPIDTCIRPAETAEEPGSVHPLNVGSGIVHPNAAGYREGYAPAIADSMRSLVENHIRPRPVANLRIQDQSTREVFLAWNELSTTETEYRVLVRSARVTGGANRDVTHVLRANATDITLNFDVPTTGTAEVTPCYVGPTRREVCGAPRSIDFTNFAPTVVPSNVRASTALGSAIISPDRPVVFTSLALSWSVPEFGVIYYDVELETADGLVRRVATQTPRFLATPQLVRARVRSCNFIGCSDASVYVAGPSCDAGQAITGSATCTSASSPPPPSRSLCNGVTNDVAGICGRSGAMRP